MGPEDSDIEAFLQVGMVAYLSTRGEHRDGNRVAVMVRGWQRGGYILLDTPPGEERLPPFTQSQVCAFRFLYKGVACGCETVFLGWDGAGFTQARVAWPENMRTVSIRQHERVGIELPCTVFFPDGQNGGGVITDLSIAGLCIRSDHPSAPGTASVIVSFSLPNGCAIERAEAAVRSVRSAQSTVLLGCQFTSIADSAKQDIELYVTGLIENQRRSLSGSCWALIVDEGEPGAELAASLKAEGFDALVVRGVVDAFYRLRTSLPSVLLLSGQVEQLPAAHICRLVKKTRGLDKLPVFVYGGASATAKEGGADAYFPSHTEPSLIARVLEIKGVEVPAPTEDAASSN